MPQQDYRARLQPKNINQATTILGPRDKSNILFPLYSTGGVLFPYTPSVTTGNIAEYDTSTFTHTIYNYNAYIRSYPKPISITAEFTAQSNDEALYLLAVIHFFRAVTKSYFGVTPYNRAGTPPGPACQAAPPGAPARQCASRENWRHPRREAGRRAAWRRARAKAPPDSCRQSRGAGTKCPRNPFAGAPEKPRFRAASSCANSGPH